MNSNATREIFLSAFQKRNRTIYGVVNDQCYEARDIVSRLHHFASHLGLQEKRGRADYYTAMALSWTMALANRLWIDFAEIDREAEEGIPASSAPEAQIAALGVMVGELDRALEQFRGTHEAQKFNEVEAALRAVIQSLFEVARSLGFDLTDAVERHFADGCPHCKSIPCKEGYTAHTLV